LESIKARAIRKARIFTIAVHECSRNYIIQSHPAAKHAGVCMQLSLQNIPENKRDCGCVKSCIVKIGKSLMLNYFFIFKDGIYNFWYICKSEYI